MTCAVCDSNNDLKRHCGSQTCNWVRCTKCQTVTEMYGNGHFEKAIKDQKKND